MSQPRTRTYQIVKFLFDNPEPINIRQLARALEKDAPNLVYPLAVLENKGWIVKKLSGKKAKLVTLTTEFRTGLQKEFRKFPSISELDFIFDENRMPGLPAKEEIEGKYLTTDQLAFCLEKLPVRTSFVLRMLDISRSYLSQILTNGASRVPYKIGEQLKEVIAIFAPELIYGERKETTLEELIRLRKEVNFLKRGILELPLFRKTSLKTSQIELDEPKYDESVEEETNDWVNLCQAS